MAAVFTHANGDAVFAFKSLIEMPRKEAALVAAVLVAAMGYTIIALEWLPHMTIIAAITALLAYGLSRGLKYDDMQQGMIVALSRSMGGSGYRVVEVSLQQNEQTLAVPAMARAAAYEKAGSPEPVFDSPGSSTVQQTANGTIQY